MEFNLINRKEQDLGRGVALLGGAAVLVLLKSVVPFVAPLVLGAYAVYRLLAKNYSEALGAVLLAVVFWFLMDILGWLFWLLGAGMAGFGLFFLIRAVRGRDHYE